MEEFLKLRPDVNKIYNNNNNNFKKKKKKNRNFKS